jgi:hypothetical protein
MDEPTLPITLETPNGVKVRVYVLTDNKKVLELYAKECERIGAVPKDYGIFHVFEFTFGTSSFCAVLHKSLFDTFVSCLGRGAGLCGGLVNVVVYDCTLVSRGKGLGKDNFRFFEGAVKLNAGIGTGLLIDPSGSWGEET